eukprot:Skav234955  [mRNA]  locus=scaffold2817:265678:266001:- [translate_table: standard]
MGLTSYIILPDWWSKLRRWTMLTPLISVLMTCLGFEVSPPLKARVLQSIKALSQTRSRVCGALAVGRELPGVPVRAGRPLKGERGQERPPGVPVHSMVGDRDDYGGQ